MKGTYRLGSLVAALVCGIALIACGGDGDGADVDALTSCLEDAGLEVDPGEVDKEEADNGITDVLSAGSPDAPAGDSVQIANFESADKAEEYTSDFSGDLEQVDSILLFSLDRESEDYDQAISCAEDATG